jgi:hypothetical protein
VGDVVLYAVAVAVALGSERVTYVDTDPPACDRGKLGAEASTANPTAPLGSTRSRSITRRRGRTAE